MSPIFAYTVAGRFLSLNSAWHLFRGLDSTQQQLKNRPARQQNNTGAVWKQLFSHSCQGDHLLITIIYFLHIYGTFTLLSGCWLTHTVNILPVLRDGVFLRLLWMDVLGLGGYRPGWNPHQWSRSVSAHWALNHSSLCRKDSVRLMRGRPADGLRFSLAAASLPFGFHFGFTWRVSSPAPALPLASTADWWWAAARNGRKLN